MNEKIPYWGSVLFSAVALFLLLVNIMIADVNRMSQYAISERQNTIAGGQTLNQVNQALIQMMAEASLKDNDTQLHDLLTAQGITLKNEAPAPAKSTDKK
jgi:hypothetical protein